MCEYFGDLFFSGEIQTHEHRPDALARALLLGQRRLQILLRNQTGLNQALAELFAHFF